MPTDFLKPLVKINRSAPAYTLLRDLLDNPKSMLLYSLGDEGLTITDLVLTGSAIRDNLISFDGLEEIEPELPKRMKELFSIDIYSKIRLRDVNIWLNHWLDPGVLASENAIRKDYLVEINTLQRIKPNEQIVLYAKMYSLYTQSFSSESKKNVQLTLTFEQLESIYPGAAAKLEIGIDMGLTNDELLAYALSKNVVTVSTGYFKELPCLSVT